MGRNTKCKVEGAEVPPIPPEGPVLGATVGVRIAAAVGAKLNSAEGQRSEVVGVRWLHSALWRAFLVLYGNYATKDASDDPALRPLSLRSPRCRRGAARLVCGADIPHRDKDVEACVL